MIRQARREVSRASGIPLSPGELETERRERELKALNIAFIRELGAEIYLTLGPEVQWDGNQPYATFLIHDIPFEVRKVQQGKYKLTAGDDAQELLDMSASDPAVAHALSRCAG